MKINQRVGIIGCGNMGTAILAGLVKNRIVSPGRIIVYDKVAPKARRTARRWKVRLGKSNGEVVRYSTIVLLAVKPQDLFEAAQEFRQAFKRQHLLISILAGTPIAKVRQAVGPRPAIARAMPNLGAVVGEAITALTTEKVGVRKPHPKGGGTLPLRLAGRIFSGCGRTVFLPEKFFDLVTALSGSGPAYFFLLMELLTIEGVKRGLRENVARDLTVQTALGSSLLALHSTFSPAQLRRQVTSKGGTTAAALKVFEEEGFEGMVSRSLGAAIRRARELSRMK